MRGRKYSFFTLSAIRKPDALRSCQYTFHKNSSTKKIDPGINYYRKHKQEQVLRVNLASVSSLKKLRVWTSVNLASVSSLKKLRFWTSMHNIKTTDNTLLLTEDQVDIFTERWAKSGLDRNATLKLK